MGDVARHYAGDELVAAVREALDQVVPEGETVSVDALGGFDDFHTAGRHATDRLAELLAPEASDVVLDAGCGLGGPARYLAARFGCRVIGVDLTPAFVEVARLINDRTSGVGDRVEFRVGDITALDLPDASVDHVWTQHVAMNVADRDALYAELRRVMRPGGRFLLFDVVDGGGGELILPVPWATEPGHSHLVTAEALRAHLEANGFAVEVWEDPTAEYVEILRAMLAGPPPGAPTSPLHPGLFIPDLKTKGESYFRNMEEGRTALALALCTAV